MILNQDRYNPLLVLIGVVLDDKTIGLDFMMKELRELSSGKTILASIPV